MVGPPSSRGTAGVLRSQGAVLLAVAWCAAAHGQALVVPSGATVSLDGGASYDSVEVGEDATLLVAGPLEVAGDLVIRPRARVSAPAPVDGGWASMRLSVDGGLRVEAGGLVDLTGLGLAGGLTFDPLRNAVVPSTLAGKPGGSHFAAGAGAAGATAYDDPSAPTLPGSSAGGFGATPQRAASGGGVLLVAARALVLDGLMAADGASGRGTSYGSGGGGGSLNLTVGALSGSGWLRASGGEADCGGYSVSYGGAGGLVRVSYATSDFAGGIDVRGGPSREAGCGLVEPRGGDGTALFVDRTAQRARAVAGTYPLRSADRFDGFEIAPGATARLLGAAEVRQPLRVAPSATLVLAAPSALDAVRLESPLRGALRVEVDLSAPSLDLSLADGAQLVVNRRLVLRALVLEHGALATHDPQVTTMALEATSALRVRAGARIDATGRGLPGLTTIDPATLLPMAGSHYLNGGSHGGLGGQAEASRPVAPTYDDPEDPRLPGAGGGTGGSAGGGVLRLRAPLVEVDGLVAANGQAVRGGEPGGAGGSVIIEAGSLAGAGEISANGASWPEAAQRASGGGGGGLVLLATGSSAFSGSALAEGGFGSSARGGAGKVTWRTVEHPPRIVSVPPARATAGLAFSYAAQAAGTPPFDWALVSGPEGARLEAATGRLTWLPSSLGEATFDVSVSSAFGRDVQSFSITVTSEAVDGGWLEDGGARAPFFASTPNGTASCGAPYRYDVDGLPAVGGAGPFTFAVAPHLEVPLPKTLSVDPVTGELRWTPSRADVGAHPLELSVESPWGRAVQRFAVVVTCPPPTELSGCGCAAPGTGHAVTSPGGGPGSPSEAPPWTAVLLALALLLFLVRPRPLRSTR